MSTEERPLLFRPIELRGVTAPNRIMMSPMCQYVAADGVPGEWHSIHLASRAVGGAGVVMTEATAIEPRGRISPYDVALHTDEQEHAWARIAAQLSEFGTVPGIQLAHAGQKGSHGRPWEARPPLRVDEGGWDVIGPSPVAATPGDLVPIEMSTDDIAEVVARWRDAAARALRAGFRLVEIHAGHGYLLHQFLSPLCNFRTDRYGGDLESRARLTLEVVEAVRSVWPDDLPLSVRVSATDWVEGGWTLDDTVSLAGMLHGRGVDIIDCSSGGASPLQRIDVHPGYQVPFASEVRTRIGVMTAAVGMIVDPHQAEEILQEGHADLVVLGRMLLWDPYWPRHAAAALGVPLDLPLPYERAGIHAATPLPHAGAGQTTQESRASTS